MATFKDANQVRLSLKMKLSNHSWYKTSDVIVDNDGYGVCIKTAKSPSPAKHKEHFAHIRKYISPVINGVNVKIESEG